MIMDLAPDDCHGRIVFGRLVANLKNEAYSSSEDSK